MKRIFIFLILLIAPIVFVACNERGINKNVYKLSSGVPKFVNCRAFAIEDHHIAREINMNKRHDYFLIEDGTPPVFENCVFYINDSSNSGGNVLRKCSAQEWAGFMSFYGVEIIVKPREDMNITERVAE